MQMKLKSLYQGLIGFLLATVLGCGSQDDNRATPSLLDSLDQIEPTNSIERLSGLFVSANHPISYIDAYADLLWEYDGTDYKFFLTPLPNYDISPRALVIKGFMEDPVGNSTTNYYVDLTPGYLYQIALKDDNEHCYEEDAVGTKQYFRLSVISSMTDAAKPNNEETYQHIEIQPYQPDFETNLSTYIYFPESDGCTKAESCIQDIQIQVALYDAVNYFNVEFPCHELTIDAITINSNASQLDQKYIIQKNVFQTLTNDGISIESDFGEFVGLEFIEINNILFSKRLFPDDYEFKNASIELPSPNLWFSTYYIKRETNLYQYKQENNEYLSTFFGPSRVIVAGQIHVLSNTSVTQQEHFSEYYQSGGKSIEDQRDTTGNWYISLPAE